MILETALLKFYNFTVNFTNLQYIVKGFGHSISFYCKITNPEPCAGGRVSRQAAPLGLLYIAIYPKRHMARTDKGASGERKLPTPVYIFESRINHNLGRISPVHGPPL